MLETISVVGGIAAMQVSVWLYSVLAHDASLVDRYWGIGFVIATVICFSRHAGAALGQQLLLLMLTMLWAIRLSLYLTWRNWGQPEDRRYREMRQKHKQNFWWISFFTVYVLQGAAMMLVSLPLQYGQQGPLRPNAPLFQLVGTAVFLVGWFFESIADLELATFLHAHQNDEHKRVMNKGLWRYSRHPNYFGSSVVHFGLFIVALASEATPLWTIISPIFMLVCLLRVTGASLLEKDISSRRPEYEEYKRVTSEFIPWPPKR